MAVKVKLRLALWPTRDGGYRGGQPDLPEFWRVGETHEVSQETAMYLRSQFPDLFVKPSKQEP